MRKSKKAKQIERQSPISTAEAAAHCHVSSPTFKRCIERGDVAPYRTPGGHHRIRVEEFQRFLQQGGRPSYPAASRAIPLLIVDDELDMVQVLAEFPGHVAAVPALLAAGAHACLVKPVQLADLARTVDRLPARARPPG